jgi:hypothetical protein
MKARGLKARGLKVCGLTFPSFPCLDLDTVLQADEGCDFDFLRPEIGEVAPVSR